jgi:hypothetical protein
MRWGAAWVVAVAACYHPAAELPCTVSCETGETCPGGLTCGANGLCQRVDEPCTAMPPPDVPVPDSPPCTLGPFGPRVPIMELSSIGDFADPTLRGDGLEMLFVRGTAGTFDIWRTTRTSPDIAWGPPQAAGDLNSTTEEDTDPALTRDGLSVLFCRTEGGKHVYEATRNFGEPMFGAPQLALGFEGQTVSGMDISADGLTLYFMKSMTDDTLWKVTRMSRQAMFGTPTSLGTLAQNIYPSISADELDVYFDSGGIKSRHRDSVANKFDGPDSAIIDNGNNPEISYDNKTLIISAAMRATMRTRDCQ